MKLQKLAHPPKIDGIIENNSEWIAALKIEDFHQFQPKEKGSPSEKTILFIGFDKDYLYLAAKCSDSEPKKIRGSLVQRDKPINDDWIAIFLDTFREKRRAYVFGFNPLGIQMDGLQIEEGGENKSDTTWDAIFYSKGRITQEGYEIEAKIAFKSLRFPDEKKKTWGFFVKRNIPRKTEVITFPSVSKNIPGFLSQAAEILIDGEIERGKNIELMPTLTSLKRWKDKFTNEVGANLKIGLTSDLIVDFTVNPDFSHVEADSPQIDINQRYALSWPEKRPFFLEGNEIFIHPTIDLIYTRRIIDPQWGAKITGKAGGLTLGYIGTMDNSYRESLWDISGEGITGEKKSLFNIFRTRLDISKESYIGLTFTDKKTKGTSNRVAGMDGQFKFKRHFFLTYQAVFSKTNNEINETAIVPAFSLAGSYSFRHWNIGISYDGIHPEFETSAGFVNRTGYHHFKSKLAFSIYPERRYLHQITPSLTYCKFFDFKGFYPIERWFLFKLDFRLANNNELDFLFSDSMERYQEYYFRKRAGGLSIRNYMIAWLEFEGTLDIGEAIKYDPDKPYLGWSVSGSFWLNFKPADRIRLGISYLKYTF